MVKIARRLCRFAIFGVLSFDVGSLRGNAVGKGYIVVVDIRTPGRAIRPRSFDEFGHLSCANFVKLRQYYRVCFLSVGNLDRVPHASFPCRRTEKEVAKRMGFTPRTFSKMEEALSVSTKQTVPC